MHDEEHWYLASEFVIQSLIVEIFARPLINKQSCKAAKLKTLPASAGCYHSITSVCFPTVASLGELNPAAQ